MTPPKFIPARIVPDETAPTGLRWEGLPCSGPITSGFAAYEPYRASLGWGEHNSVDIAPPCGTPILAAYPGVVHYAFGDGVGGVEEGSLGTFIVLRHEQLDPMGRVKVWFTGYAHLLMQAMVNVGDWVEQGQPIGAVGYSGAVTPPGPAGAHLHFGVMEGAGYFNRDLDTFTDPELMVGAEPVPAALPAPKVGDPVRFIGEIQSLEAQAVFGGKVIVLPETYQLTDEDYRLSVLGRVPELVREGTPVRRYTVLATAFGEREPA
jgi:murein DD-endopeptidase MepM/ murein hydrolase activator NlpD